jgi:hypothetical protein
VFAGAQLQATPACALSFDTVAETVAVPPGTTFGASEDRTTEMVLDCVPGSVPGWEPPPQPELNKAKIKAASEKSDSPLISFFKFIGPPNLGAALLRRLLETVEHRALTELWRFTRQNRHLLRRFLARDLKSRMM